MVRTFFAMNAVLLILSAGCSRSNSPEAHAPAQPPGTNQRSFQVKGVVLEVGADRRSVTIKHEAVPDYMPAMTMPFDVKDTNVLAGIEAGDPVSFRLVTTDTEGWIDQIRATGPKTNSLPTTGPFRLVRDVDPLKNGDPLPEYRFTNQFGQIVSTTQFKGQALAINFLFTRCPFPNFCPRMANNFEQAQAKLAARAGGPTNWHLLTITFDPDFDTPAVLKKYAESHQYDPAHWSFATGELIDITAIGEQMGLTFWHEEGNALPSHNLRTAVVDAAGRVQKIFAGNQWQPEELVDEMVKAAAVKR